MTSAQLAVAWTRPAEAGPDQAAPATTTTQDALNRVMLPDVFAVAPKSITNSQLARLGKLRYVRGVITMDAGQVAVDGHKVNMIGVNPAAFRAWTPLQSAAPNSAWTALGKGGFVSTAAAARKLGLRPGHGYRITAAASPVLSYGGTVDTGLPAVDAVVSEPVSHELGLVARLGALISAPGAAVSKLDAQVRALLGKSTKFVSLVPAKRTPASSSVSSSQGPLPVDNDVSRARPDSYLGLFEAAARWYCPGLSWTVLAAIGQIESGDGQNEGPSSAGALGPMQFLPSSWRIWGIDAFGETGKPDVMNPYDAVPAAANYLCASGAARGGAALASAIFAYNHATWYVNEVLALAHEYAQEYG